MATRPRWVYLTLQTRRCRDCGHPFRVEDVQAVQVGLEPFADGRSGFAAATGKLTVVCSHCGSEWDIDADDGIKPKLLKMSITWLLSRLGEVKSPFYPEADACDCDDPLCGQPDSPEGKGTKDGEGSGGGTGSGAKGEASPPPLEFDRAVGDPPAELSGEGEVPPLFRRRRVQPSIRPGCPKKPITDETVEIARRQLRRMSADRRRPGFVKLMRNLGVDVESDEHGDQP